MQIEKSYEILCKTFNDEAKTTLEVNTNRALLDWFNEPYVSEIFTGPYPLSCKQLSSM